MQHEEDSLGLNDSHQGGEDQQIQDSLVQDHEMNNREDEREREHDQAPSGPRSSVTTSTVDYSYKQRNGPKQDVVPTNVLGVFGLSVRTTEKDIEDAFSEVGHVEKVVILYDGQTGRSRGFGFVTMADLPEAEACIAKLSGMVKLHGRQLRVDFSNTATPHGKTPGEYRGPRRDAYANRGPNYNAQQGGYEGRSGYQGAGGDRGGSRSYPSSGYGDRPSYQSSGGGDYRSSRDGGRDSRDSRGGEERYSSSSSRDPYSSRRREERDDYRGSSSRGGEEYRSSSHRGDPRDSREHGSSRRERSRSPERRRRESRSPPRGGEPKEEAAPKW